MATQLNIGEIYSVKYPFVRTNVTLFDEEDAHDVEEWRPGVDAEQDDGGYCHYFAEGHGEMLLTIIDIHKPGQFPTRVFYTRKWRDPDGKMFGKNGLRITTKAAFNSLLRGYRHEYEFEEAEV